MNVVVHHARTTLGLIRSGRFASVVALPILPFALVLGPGMVAELPPAAAVAMVAGLSPLGLLTLGEVASRSGVTPGGAADLRVPMAALPLSPRSRVLGETLAAAVPVALMVPLALLASAGLGLLDQLVPGNSLARQSLGASGVLAAAAVLLTSVPGAATPEGQTSWRSLLGSALPPVVAVVTWRSGLLAPGASVLAAVVTAVVLTAVGPLPRFPGRLQWRRPRALMRSRVGMTPTRRLWADTLRGLWLAPLKALPVALLSPILLAGRHLFEGPAPTREDQLWLAVCLVFFAGSTMPCGRRGMLQPRDRKGVSAWASLPVPDHQVARSIYLHVAVMMLAGGSLSLAGVWLAEGAAGAESSTIALGMVTAALPFAAHTTMSTIGQSVVTGRVYLGALASFAAASWAIRMGQSVGAVLVLLAIALACSLLAGMLPVVSLLLPRQLAPAPLTPAAPPSPT